MSDSSSTSPFSGKGIDNDMGRLVPAEAESALTGGISIDAGTVRFLSLSGDREG